MVMKNVCCVLVCYAMAVFGIAPELYCMPVSSARCQTQAEKSGCRTVTAKLAHHNIHVKPDELFGIIGAREIRTYSADGTAVCGGGYYGVASTGQSSFFSNVENFLVELVEFFLFLAMLSYVVGYEEWLPWEDDEDE